MRTVLIPSRRPSASTSGPPDEPRGSGAVCSIEPPMRRPRGPRKLRARSRSRGRTSCAARGRRGRRARTPAAPCAAAPGRRVPGDRRARRRCRPRSPRRRGRRRRRRPGRARRSPSANADGDLVAAQHVRVGEHAAVADHDAGAAAPAAAEADDRRPDPLGGGGHGACSSSRTACAPPECTHAHLQVAPSSGVNLRVALQVTATQYQHARAVASDSAMGRRRHPHAPPSPLADALARVGDRWTLLVVAALLEGAEALQRAAGGARRDRAQRAQRAAEGARPSRRSSSRSPYSERPPRFVYELTESGPRAGRRAAAARRLGRAHRRRRRAATATPPAAPRSRRAGGARTASMVVDDPDADDVIHV